MRGIPKTIATKTDLKNLCRDLPHRDAKKLLKGLTQAERKRLRVSNIELQDLTKMVAARKRVITRKRNALETARKTLAGKQSDLVAARENEIDIVRQISKIELSQRETPDYAGRIQSLKTDMLDLEAQIAEDRKRAAVLRQDQKQIKTALGRIDKKIDGYTGSISAVRDRIALARSGAECMRNDRAQLEDLQQQAKDIHVLIQGLNADRKRCTQAIERLEV